MNRIDLSRRMRPGIYLAAIVLSLTLPSLLRAETAPQTSFSPPPPTASIFGTDDRRRVTNTTMFPWSAIGLVQVNYGYEAYVGTGVMIGRRLALTCAHVAYTPGSTPDSIEFIPGQNGSSEPFGRAMVLQVLPSEPWVTYRDDGYDMAILVLDRPIGDDTGYFQIAVQPDAFFADREFEAAGYPTDLGGLLQYTVAGNSIGMQGNVILHYLDTEPGQSGSPMWYGDASQGKARLVGLMEGSYLTTGPFGTTERGIAARIDQLVANWIDEQLAAHNDDPQDISAPVDPGTLSPFRTGLCGLGATPFLMLSSFGWSVRFVFRRVRLH